jgi:hypothetical protein
MEPAEIKSWRSNFRYNIIFPLPNLYGWKMSASRTAYICFGIATIVYGTVQNFPFQPCVDDKCALSLTVIICCTVCLIATGTIQLFTFQPCADGKWALSLTVYFFFAITTNNFFYFSALCRWKVSNVPNCLHLLCNSYCTIFFLSSPVRMESERFPWLFTFPLW